jgi:hypothetical protein
MQGVGFPVAGNRIPVRQSFLSGYYEETVARRRSQAFGIRFVLARLFSDRDFRWPMSIRILVLGAVLSILASAFILALWVLDFIPAAYFRQGLAKMLAIIGIATVAAVLIDAIIRSLRRK